MWIVTQERELVFLGESGLSKLSIKAEFLRHVYRLVYRQNGQKVVLGRWIIKEIPQEALMCIAQYLVKNRQGNYAKNFVMEELILPDFEKHALRTQEHIDDIGFYFKTSWLDFPSGILEVGD